MSDISMGTKAKILAWLDADPNITALVPASSIFPMEVSSDQTKPFLRYGEPTVRPYEDWCGVGVELTTTIHCYTVGETDAQIAAAAVQRSLSGMEGIVSYDWVRTQFRQDPDDDSIWDGMVTFVVVDR